MYEFLTSFTYLSEKYVFDLLNNRGPWPISANLDFELTLPMAKWLAKNGSYIYDNDIHCNLDAVFNC